MIRAIVTDIEGTTSSISFVHDVLFPYAREHIRQFVCRSVQDGAATPHINDVRMQTGRMDMSLDEVADQLIQWIDEDKKITPLKALQGMIWEQGYKNADFKGHVYADAVACLKAWKQQGIQLYVYSSGSIYAQKLLFGYSDFGDMTPLFTGYIDTTTGAKGDAKKKKKIATAINLPAQDILFLSDIEKELDAARTAGMKTVWLVRKGKVAATATHPQVNSFNDINIANM
ncbi:MAG: acireductone synthase [Gammaproteobacteria bacterium]|nr:acireductone synthase [Gammaproteobacteria bacterium]